MGYLEIFALRARGVCIRFGLSRGETEKLYSQLLKEFFPDSRTVL